MGHLQVVIGLLDQLYRNAWSVLGESRGGLRSHYTNGYNGHGFPGGISQTTNDIPPGNPDHGTHCCNEISTPPP